MTVSTKCRLCEGRSVLDTPTIRVIPYRCQHHIRAYYCQNCFKHIAEWVRKEYPLFMRRGEVNTAYYATMLGLKKPNKLGEPHRDDDIRLGQTEMDDKAFGLGTLGRNVDSPFMMKDVPEPEPLRHFFPVEKEELERVVRESREELIT